MLDWALSGRCLGVVWAFYWHSLGILWAQTLRPYGWIIQ
ncbi:putative membrane protein [Lyngbya aestuarii BL J]|uniref:Putative membrane protein n=1 Tax=Lyngbya aestuarii BL J TaxID=1348334 RepID=U7QP29_9CYAN|nr:putative membrane protein [Lyngbya aestuarii BL J]